MELVVGGARGGGVGDASASLCVARKLDELPDACCTLCGQMSLVTFLTDASLVVVHATNFVSLVGGDYGAILLCGAIGIFGCFNVFPLPSPMDGHNCD